MAKKKPQDLAILEKCRGQLMQMTQLSSVLDIRDKAVAMRHYLKAKGDARDSQNAAASIALLSEARAGQLIKEGQKDGTISGRGRKNQKSQVATFDLEDLGVTKSASQRCQLAAAVLEKDPTWFDRARDECTENNRDLTQQAVIRRGKELQKKKPKPKPPRGTFDVIVIDPPWPMEKIEREVRPNQAAFDYDTMTEDDLKELRIPAAEDCHMWLWTTHRFLPMALRLAAAWKFRYVCTFVWHKTGGFQPVGLPQYNCEFALYCRKGSPEFKSTRGLRTCFSGVRRKHSQKPQEFYDMVVNSCGLTRRNRGLDMFNREKISCFEGWGDEST